MSKRRRLRELDEGGEWFYLAALVPGCPKVIYMRVDKYMHSEVFDLLYDGGCRIYKLAESKWRRQVNDTKHPDWDPHGIAYEISVAIRSLNGLIQELE
jgi:hypothetical protein